MHAHDIQPPAPPSPGVQPPAQGTGWALPTRPNLRIPVVKGHIPCGRAVANSIERIVAAYPLDSLLDADDDIETICSEISSRSHDSLSRLGETHFRGRPLLDGVLGQGRVFAALLAHGTPDPRVDALRACLLASALAPEWPRGLTAAIDSVANKILAATSDAALISVFPRQFEAIGTDIWARERLVESLAVFTAEPDTTPTTAAARSERIARIVLPAHGESSKQRAKPKKRAVRRRTRPSGRFVPKPPAPPPELDVPDELPLDDVVEPERWFAPPVFEIDDDAADSDTTPSTNDEPASPEVLEFERLNRTRLFLAGVLLPDTERVLTHIECQELFEILADLAFEAPFLQADTERLLGHTALLLILITGRDLRECATAISNLLVQRTCRPGWLEIEQNRTHWIGAYPIVYPNAPEPSDGWAIPTTPEIRLPLPPEMAHALKELQAARLPRLDSQHIYQCAEQVLRELKCILNRLTLTRLGNTLATTLYAQTGHSQYAQLVCGSDLAQSSAPNHYYAAPASVLADHYRQALAAFGITLPANGVSPPDEWIGAPSAAIKQAALQTAVRALVERTEATIQVAPNSGIDRWIAALIALQTYTAILFGVCCAYRFTSAIGEVTRHQIVALTRSEKPNAAHSTGIAVVCDKGADRRIVATRACALPPVFMAQLNVLFDHQQRLLTKLEGDKAPELRSLKQWLENAVTGTGPIWFTYHSSFGTCDSITRQALVQGWHELPFPIQLFRHNFSSNAGSYSIRACDAAQQMGHSVGADPFDDCDPDAPSDFADRLSAPLGLYVGDMGFRTLGTVHRRNRKPVPLPFETGLAILEAEQADQAAFRTLVTAATASEQPESVSEEVEKTVRAWQETCYADMTSSQQTESIRSFLARIASERPDPGFQDAVRDRLQQVLEGEANRLGQTARVAIPRLYRAPPTISPIRETHLRAYLWATRLNDESLKAIALAARASHRDQLLIHGLLLLALWGCGTQLQDLLALLDERTDLHTTPALRGIVVAAVARSNYSDGDKSVQTIPPGAEALIIKLRQCFQGEAIDNSSIEKALKGEQALLEVIGATGINALESTLTIIALARQITASGQHCGWERGTLATVGPSLERFWAILHNDVSVKDRRPPPENVLHVSEAPPAGGPPASGFQAFRKIQGYLSRLKQSANSGVRRQQLDDYLTQTQESFGSTTLIGIFAQQVRHDLAGSRRVASTLLTYGSRLRPLFQQFAGEDYRYSDIQLILDACRHIAITQHTGTARRQSAQPTAIALSWLSEGFTNAGLTLDYEEALADIAIPAVRHPGYLCSNAERDWLIQQTVCWSRQARTNPAYAADSHLLTAACIASILQFHSGMRLNEVAGLHVTDFKLYRDGCLINVRYRASRRLKTRASSRPIFVELDASTIAILADMLNALHKRRTDTGNDLLATEYRAGVAQISNRYASVMRPILKAVLPVEGARLHAARHTLASAAGYTVNRERYEFDLSIGFSQPTETRVLQGLPLRDVYRYYSRRLGHGHPRTTLIHYDHMLTLQSDSARGWILPSNKFMGLLLGQADYSSIVKRNKARRATSEAFTPRHLLTRGCIGYTHVGCAAPDPLPLPTVSRGTDFELLITLARLALRRRENLPMLELGNEVGLDPCVANRWVEWLELVDRFLQTRYFDVPHAPAQHSRVPRSHRYLPFVQSLQRLLVRGDIDVRTISKWVMRQPRGPRCRTFVFQSNDEVLWKALVAPSARSAQRDDGRNSEFSIDPSDRSFLLLVLFGYSEAVLYGNVRTTGKIETGLEPIAL